MKIVSLNFEVIRATPAIAEFVVRVGLDRPATGCEITGHAVGPRCEGISTVEVAYPMTVAASSDPIVSLRCAIPAPNLWTSELRFTYAVSIALHLGEVRVDSRGGVVALRAR